MDIGTIAEKLKLKMICGESRIGEMVTGGYVGDLLSDVMGNSKKGDIWVTRQVHQNTVAVAALKELAAIVIVQNALPDADTVQRAETEGVVLLVSAQPAFEVVGEIYRLLHGA
jgi:hypothetical protein